ncbi:MAG: Rrf2 family transcriptional regulator [Acidaminobacteraceae bacterium]
MKLSTRGRYGLKAMFDLSINYGKGPISLNIISERQNVSLNYLEQLMAPLKKAKLVESVRGKQGGYMLAKAPNEISVGDVLIVLEGELAPTDCVKEFTGDECTNADCCVTRIIYEKIKKSIDAVVYSITLQDMLDDKESMGIVEIDTTTCHC